MKNFLSCILITLLSLTVFADDADDLVNGVVSAPVPETDAAQPSSESPKSPVVAAPAAPAQGEAPSQTKSVAPIQVQTPSLGSIGASTEQVPSEPSIEVPMERVSSEPSAGVEKLPVSSDFTSQGRDVAWSIRGGAVSGGIHRPDAEGVGGFTSLLIPCGNSLDLRISGFYFDMEDDNGLMERQYSGNARLAFRLADHNGFVPYVGAGAFYHMVEWDSSYKRRYRSGWYSYTHTYYESHDENDTQPIVFAGVVRDGTSWHFLLDAAYIPGMYDSSAQVELEAEIGVKLGSAVRLDVGVLYFSEWETSLVNAGLTFLF